MTATSSRARRLCARVVIFLACMAGLATVPARADDPLSTFFAQVFAAPTAQPGIIKPLRRHMRERAQGTMLASDVDFRHLLVGRENQPSGVRALIASQVTARLGPAWVPTALRIAEIESRGNCAAYNRGAIGVFQVRHPERFGVSSSAARTCAGGVSAGVAHMAMCITKGARTSGQMMACHNTGSPHGRVERAYRMALGA